MVFKIYGEVTNVHIIDGKPAGTNKVAFVEYANPDSSQTAIQALDGEYRFRRDSESAIRVSVARPKNSKGGGKGDRDRSWGSGGGYNDWGGRGGRDDYDGRRGGDDYGGRGGRGRDDYDNRRGDNGPYARRDGGGGGYDRYDRGGGGRGGYDGYDGGKGGRGGWEGDRGGGRGDGRGPPHRPPGPKLHIGNLPNDITRDALEQVFGTYGPLSDVHIMERQDGPCAAFVTYASEGDARKCVAAMEQGYEIRPGQGNINVTYAKAKEDRGGNRSRPY